MEQQHILYNQLQAIDILQDSLQSNSNLLLDYKCSHSSSFALDSIPNCDEIIKSNSRLINVLAYQLSKNIPDKPWFIDINNSRIRKYENSKEDFLLSNLRISEDFAQLISLNNSVRFGTWGKHKVVLPSTHKIDASSSTDILMFVVHCNLHNTESRNNILKNVISRYRKMLLSVGIKDIIIHTTNKIQTNEDIEFAHHKHAQHQHWSPATTVRFFQRIYAKYPRSIILTHPYIASLFLDNGLLFTFDSSLVVDEEKLVSHSFSSILNYASKNC